MSESVEHSPIHSLKATKVDPLKDFPVKHDTPSRKVLFLGDKGIGKTTFILNYCEQVSGFYKCSTYNGPRLVFTQFLFNHQQDGKQIPIQLMDLPAGTNEESRGDRYPDEVDAIVMCFAIDNPTSFANVWKVWVPESSKYYPDFTRCYLLGLRSDLRQEMIEANKTPVTPERGRQIHQKYKFRGEYVECSVRKNHGQAIILMNALISDLLCSGTTPVEV